MPCQSLRNDHDGKITIDDWSRIVAGSIEERLVRPNCEPIRTPPNRESPLPPPFRPEGNRAPMAQQRVLNLGDRVLLPSGRHARVSVAALAAKAATREVPIVAASVDNPVDMGLAATMARPGGNITGISAWAGELVEKRLQLLHEFTPGASRVGILFNPDAGVTRAGLENAIVHWERTLGIQIRTYDARTLLDFQSVFADLARDGVGGLVVLADGNTYTHRKALNDLCLERRMPSVWGGRDFLTGGGLASYQSDLPAIFKRAATLVDYILKGQKPADIPFEQATKLELVVDKRAAKALRIAVPQAVLLAADDVFE